MDELEQAVASLARTVDAFERQEQEQRDEHEGRDAALQPARAR